MYLRRRAVAFLLSLGLAVQVAYSAPPVPADGGQSQPESVPALLRIRVIEGEGSIHTAGSRSSQPIVVFLADEAGRAVAGAAVSVQLPVEGPTGLFANGMRTEIVVTGADGRAVIRGIEWGRAAGPVQVRITASKGEARAGILSTLNITERAGTRPAHKPAPVAGPAPPSVEPAQPSRSKWILFAALAGGAAVAGVAAAARRGGVTPGGAPSGPGAISAPAASIGIPTITIGRP